MSSEQTTTKGADNGQRRSLVPELRFPEFREAEGWIAKSLKNACEVNPENSALPEQFVYIDLESVESGELKTRKIINRDEAPSRAQRLLRFGDVIFQIVRPYQRNNLHLKSDDVMPYVASTGYAQLRANESDDFLFHAVHTDDFVDRVIAKCTGSSYPAINSSDLAEISLSIPNKDEQKRIADCLSSLDELISAEGQKLDVLKAHKKGLMQQLFPAEDETTPRLRFPEFLDADEWETECISDLGKIVTGSTPSTAIPEFYGGERLFVSPADISGERFISRTNTTLTERGFGQTRPIPPNSILFVCIGSTIGKVAQNLVECASNQQINAVIPSAKHCAAFLFYTLTQVAPQIAALAGRHAVPIINKTAFGNVEVILPKRAEQERIAECLSSLDERITAQTRQIEALRAQKTGLMQQLFPSLDEVQA